jgi:hypothetical protein
MSRSKLLVIPLCLPLLLLAQSADGVLGGFASIEERDRALQFEVDAVFAAKEAAAAGWEGDLAAKLALPAHKQMKCDPDVNFLFRAASVCACLLNEGKPDSAVKVAKRTLQVARKAEDVPNTEQVGRLYWEAWLRAEVLDDKKTALALLDAAARLDPNDSRISYGRQRWSVAGKGGES